jgi:GAF domain-containing protein/anti-sigma regulatory factor (Ser/Thr protein kinase)
VAELQKPEFDQRFALAMRVGRMGSWSWEIASGRVEWDAHTSELFGLDPTAFEGTFDAWQARLHPDDREWVAAEIAAAVAELRPFRFDHRCVWPDGSIHWLEGVGEVVVNELGEVIGATGVTLDVDERRTAQHEREALLDGERAARVESELARQRAEGLQQISAGLARAATRADVGRVVISQLVPAMNALAGGVSELDETGTRLMFVASSGTELDDATTFPFVPLDEAVLSRDVVKSAQPVFIANRDEFEDRYPELATLQLAGGFEGVATLPLLIDGKPIGSLALVFAESRAFTPAERQYLEIVAGLCAQSLRRAQALEAEQRLGVRLARLQNISDLALARLPIDELIAEFPARIAALLECDTVRILLLDPTGRELVESGGTGYDPQPIPLRVPVGRGFAGRVAQRGEPVVLDDLSQIDVVGEVLASDIRSAAGVPLQAETLLGVLDVGSRTLRHFNDADIDLLRLAADRIARAIERGRLFDLERAARERSEFLERTNAVLTRSLEIPDIMRRVTQAAVPRLGDWCQLAVFTDHRPNSPTIEVAHVDPSKLVWAHELRDRFPYDPDALTGIPAAVRSGTTQYYPEINDDIIDLATPNRELRDILKKLSVRSSIIVPLRGRSGVLGALQLVQAESGRRYNRADVQLVEAVAARIAIALENARLYERERAIAGTLQQSLLPPHLPKIPGIDVAHRYWTASDTSLVGGDFYDVIGLGADSWGVLVGDVSGKGITAAALTGVARQTARAAARHGVGPSGVLSWLDDAVKDQADQFGGQYCTAVYGVLERNPSEWRFRFVLGGHPRPVLVPAGGEPQLIGRPGSVLGLLDAPVFHETDVTLEPGDTLLLYTDGVTDVAGPSALDDIGLLAVIAESVRDSPEKTLTALHQALEARHARVARRDDTAILALHRPHTIVSAPARAEIELPALASSPRRARRFVRDTLEPFAVPSAVIDDAELIATELVTNSVLHAHSEMTLSIECDDRIIRLRVDDHSPDRPIVRTAGPDAATGRGLFIIEQLAAQWGVDLRRGGKTVWVELAQ